MKLILRIRRFPDHGDICHVWLIQETGSGKSKSTPAVRSGVLHGTMTLDKAEQLAEQLGFPVEREVSQECSQNCPELLPETLAEKTEAMLF